MSVTFQLAPTVTNHSTVVVATHQIQLSKAGPVEIKNADSPQVLRACTSSPPTDCNCRVVGRRNTARIVAHAVAKFEARPGAFFQGEGFQRRRAGGGSRTNRLGGCQRRAAMCRMPPVLSARAAKMLLAHNGFPTNLRIGISLSEKGDLEAHVWVGSQDKVLIGGPTLEHLTPLPSFD